MVVSDCVVCLVPAFLTDFAEIGYIRFQFYITAICRQRTQQRLNIPPFARKQTELNNPRYLSTFINVFVTHFTRYAVDATSYSAQIFVLRFIISYFNKRLNIPPFARKQTELNNPRYLSTFIAVLTTHFTRYAVDATSYSNHHFVLFFIISYFNMCCILFVFYIKPQHRVGCDYRNDSCILFVFYIKPQRNRLRFVAPAGCILFVFYIKPQRGY